MDRLCGEVHELSLNATHFLPKPNIPCELTDSIIHRSELMAQEIDAPTTILLTESSDDIVATQFGIFGPQGQLSDNHEECARILMRRPQHLPPCLTVMPS